MHTLLVARWVCNWVVSDSDFWHVRGVVEGGVDVPLLDGVRGLGVQDRVEVGFCLGFFGENAKFLAVALLCPALSTGYLCARSLAVERCFPF